MNAFQLPQATKNFLLRHFLPPVCFVVALCFLVIVFQSLGFTALPPTTKRYAEAKAALAEIQKNPEQAKFRANWEKIYKDFIEIYDNDRLWPNRPAALFRAAETLEGLAKRSLSNADAKRSFDHYLKLTQAHARSPLADDALYRAAKISAAWLRDDSKALELLAKIKKEYQKGDMLTDALALEKTLIASGHGRLSPQAQQVVRSEKKKVEDQIESPSAKERLNQDYTKAKERMQNLLADSNRSCWRQPWETLEDDFLKIHKKSTEQNLGAAALYQAAQSRHQLASCSRLARDYRGAAEIYQSLPTHFQNSSLADDALWQAAQIHEGNLGNKREACRLLTELLRRYPKGDMANKARTLLAKTTRDPKSLAEASEPVELEMVSWDSLDKNRVKITLELSGQTRYTAKLVPAKTGKYLYLELTGTEIAEAIRRGITIKGSLLTKISVEKTTKSPPILRFDLKAARRFDVQSEEESRKLIVTVDARKNVSPKNLQSGVHLATAKPKNQEAKARQRALSGRALVSQDTFGLAQQLGLAVQTVVIDAGHGGKDPGTYHNNIVEKLVAMDVAKTVGRLLENNGLTVIYTRNSDTFISLSQRTKTANSQGADLFISIHVNANENSQVNGLETYYLDFARTPEAARVAALENVGSDQRMKDLNQLLSKIVLSAKVNESATLARDIQRVTLSRLKRNGSPAKDNGIKSAPFHVLVGARMPAVLVELGYCTNQEEAKKLANHRYRELLAQGLAEGIMAYRKRLLEKHTVQNSLTTRKSGAM